MGTQHSSRSTGELPLRLSPSSDSPLRDLGFEEAPASFASPPRLSHSSKKGSVLRGASRWYTNQCQPPSPSSTSNCDDLEAAFSSSPRSRDSDASRNSKNSKHSIKGVFRKSLSRWRSSSCTVITTGSPRADIETAFASPPKPWCSKKKGSSPRASPKGGCHLRERSSPAVVSSCRELVTPTTGLRQETQIVLHNGNEMCNAENENKSKDVAPAVKLSKKSFRSSMSSLKEATSAECRDEEVATPASSSKKSFRSSASLLKEPQPVESSTERTLSAECSQLSLAKAKGSSRSRPRWTRPRPGSASSGNASLSSSRSGLNVDDSDSASFHPHSPGDFRDDQRSPDSTPLANLEKMTLPRTEDFPIQDKLSLAFEPPPTPSTISDSGLSCTQSSFRSSSSWSSRPTTSSSTSSNNLLAGGTDLLGSGRNPFNHGIVCERHLAQFDCSRDSRMRASGAHTDGKTLLRSPSVKTAWGPEMIDNV